VVQTFSSACAKLDARGLKVQGITTDGSSLYPGPILGVFGPVAHQVCEFHIIAQLAKAVLKAVARARKARAACKPSARSTMPEPVSVRMTL